VSTYLSVGRVCYSNVKLTNSLHMIIFISLLLQRNEIKKGAADKNYHFILFTHFFVCITPPENTFRMSNLCKQLRCIRSQNQCVIFNAILKNVKTLPHRTRLVPVCLGFKLIKRPYCISL